MFETVIWIRKGFEDVVEEKADGIAARDDTFVFDMEETEDPEYPWKVIVESPTQEQAWKRAAILTKRYWEGMVKEEPLVQESF